MPPSSAKKRPSPFRIKVGCVVALRYRPSTGNHVTMIVPQSNDSSNDNAPTSTTSTTKPTKYPLRSLVGYGGHAEVWTDPIAGRDEGLALIGRRVRCCITRTTGTASKKPSSNGDSSAPQQAKTTQNYIVEGEIVSIFDLGSPEWLTRQAKNKRNRSSDGSFAVELLVDRNILTKVPFLERTDEDVDVDKMKKESAKRAYRNEEMIKGKNKVTVKLWLEDPSCSGIPPSAEAGKKQKRNNPNVAKWAIRKRIPNQPAQEPVLENVMEESSLQQANNNGNGVVHNDKNNNGSNNNNNNNGTGNNGSAKKSNNNTEEKNNAPTQFMGNEKDDPTQQQRNWRWLAARYFDMYLSATKDYNKNNDASSTICSKNNKLEDFYSLYSNLLAHCGGLVGEVLEVAPSTRAGTLAMVTIRRLILPEHTAAGRTCSVYNKNPGLLEAFDDYDSTLIGKVNTNDNGLDNNTIMTSVVFRVPIEELVIVSRQITRDFENQGIGGKSPEGLYIHSSYSLSADCRIPLRNMVKLDGEMRVPRPLSIKKLKKLSLCHHCRIWQPKSTVTMCENASCPLTRHLNRAAEDFASDDESERISVGWCKGCLAAVRKINSTTSNTADDSGELSLPCCTSSCTCRQCTSSIDRRIAKDSFVAAIDDIKRKENGESDRGTDDHAQDVALLDAESTLKSLQVCHFDIPPDFLPLNKLSHCSSKPIEKMTKSRTKNRAKTGGTAQKRKRDSSPSARKNSRKSKGAAARCRSPTGVPLVHPRRVARQRSEDYSVFKPTCCRLVEFKEFAAGKAARSDEPPAAKGGPTSGERTRNARELEEKDCRLITEKEKDEKTLSSRAARASQRRLVKDVAMLGGSSFNFDTLAGREAQLRFDRSTIHAWGVFADGEISAGDVIAEYRGELIGNAMAEKREREYELAKIGSDYMFRIDGLTVCDATKQGNVARFINASCDPNCYTKIISLDGKQRIVIYAKKDIKAGEELCYDYKFSLEYDESQRIPCHCGAQDCRGYMNWDKKLG